MSLTSSADHESPLEGCRPVDVTPVTLEARALESTAPSYLRELKRDFADDGLAPTELTIDACFDETCSLATQDEIDRIRGYVRAGSFLGVGSVTVTIDDVAEAETVEPALEACAERADREGIVFDLEGPMTLERYH
ncbi:hypothetical protein [Natronolimnobius baerhuensis]|uniref:DUF7961 domain-containing protein n=1 Tax=Natronolimnobius baerhuensis TaxID=253108 RepID=A0A202EDN5_9EURY|nr:hypothetical protein [Natronolimnobius baerhuensis]OVE86317.1 hypothetical protein B2G88_05930 [Natronolimnobius baerhuensis]